MIEVDGKWIMSGPTTLEECKLKSVTDLIDYVNEVALRQQLIKA